MAPAELVIALENLESVAFAVSHIYQDAPELRPDACCSMAMIASLASQVFHKQGEKPEVYAYLDTSRARFTDLHKKYLGGGFTMQGPYPPHLKSLLTKALSGNAGTGSAGLEAFNVIHMKISDPDFLFVGLVRKGENVWMEKFNFGLDPDSIVTEDMSRNQPLAGSLQKYLALGKCHSCNKLEDVSTGKFKRCSKCVRARYCSVECQLADWKCHKPICPILLQNSPS